MIGYYETEADALRDVADAITRYGEQLPAVLNLALFRYYGPDETATIAAGAELVKLALTETAAQARVP